MPGIKSIVERLAKQGDLTSEQLLDGCLDLIGPVTVGENIRQELIDHVESGGGVARIGTTDEENEIFAHRVGQALQLIAATREYQLT